MTATTIARLTGLAALMAAFAAPAQEQAPDALVKSLVSEVIEVVAQNKDTRALVELAEKKVVAHFDFQRMTRLAVGRPWSEASAAQRGALEQEFRSLLVRTYAAALTQSSGKTRVDVKPANVGPGEAETMVRTTVNEPGRKPFVIDYRMARAPGGWKVYDVVVENLSLVTNYRSSFQSEIGRTGIDGLIKVLGDKNRSLGS